MCWCSKSTAAESQWDGRYRGSTSVESQPISIRHIYRCKAEKTEAQETKRTPVRLAPLPDTASLSPTAAKTVKHHTASMMFTFSPGLQHRQPQNVTKSADGAERNKRRAETTAKLWRESATPLMVRVPSSPSHRPLTASQLIHSQHSHQTD